MKKMKKCEIWFNRKNFTATMSNKIVDYWETLSTVNKYLKKGKAIKQWDDGFMLAYVLLPY
jgi:hypothetical protein